MKLEMPTLETKRLLLRPMEIEDAADILEIYGDPRVMLGNSLMTPLVDLDEVLQFMQTTFLSYQTWGLPQAMVLEHLERGCVIGICDFHTLHDTTGEIGYLLAYRYWHQGYMKEALEAMLYAGFVHTGFSCIEAEYGVVNVASAKVLHACGFCDVETSPATLLLNDGKYHKLVKCRIRKEDFCKEQRTYRIEGGY